MDCTDSFARVQSFIKDLGFPVALAVYLVVVNNRTMRELRDAVRDLTATIGASPLARKFRSEP